MRLDVYIHATQDIRYHRNEAQSAPWDQRPRVAAGDSAQSQNLTSPVITADGIVNYITVTGHTSLPPLAHC